MDEALSMLWQKALNGSSVFTDEATLFPDFQPDFILHRDEEKLAIGEFLAPSLRAKCCGTLLVCGEPGLGKTAVTRYVLNELPKQAKLKVSYVDCRKAYTRYRIAYTIAGSFGLQVPCTGLSISEIVRRAESAVKDEFILILDGVKDFDDELKEITEIGGVKKLGIVIISDTPESFSTAPRNFFDVDSTLLFKAYSKSQVRDILWHRAQQAFKPDMVGYRAVARAATLAEGNVRKGLNLLMMAGNRAEREGTKVTENTVEYAFQNQQRDIIIQKLQNLSVHAKLILRAFFETPNGQTGLITGEIFTAYNVNCEKTKLNPLTKRRFSQLLALMNREELLKSKILNQGRYGRTKRHRIAFPRNLGDIMFDRTFEWGITDKTLEVEA